MSNEEGRAGRYITKLIKSGHFAVQRKNALVAENHKGYHRYLVFCNGIHYNCNITNNRRHLWGIKQLMH